jgi:hypothetical protein
MLPGSVAASAVEAPVRSLGQRILGSIVAMRIEPRSSASSQVR